MKLIIELFAFNKKRENDDLNSNQLEYTFKNNINIENVTFGYDESKTYIFKNLNLNIKFKELTGVIGKSGSGKSTLVDLIMGLLKPQKVTLGPPGVFVLVFCLIQLIN